jgi:hypothetical protein
MNILTPASRAQPDAGWMEQVARNATMQDSGYLNGCRYLLHDRDQKFCREFRETLAAGGVKCLPLPARSPNPNTYAERWVRSIKEECLAKLILFGEKSLQRVVSNYLEHYHQERNHLTTKARIISCCSRSLRGRQVREARLVVERGSAAYSNITAAPHEYFYHTGPRSLRSAAGVSA